VNVYYLLLSADSITEKKNSGLIQGSLKSCKFGLYNVILGNCPLKSLYTFLCKNGRAQPSKCFSDESALNLVRRIIQLASVKARDAVQSKRIIALGI